MPAITSALLQAETAQCAGPGASHVAWQAHAAIHQKGPFPQTSGLRHLTLVIHYGIMLAQGCCFQIESFDD